MKTIIKLLAILLALMLLMLTGCSSDAPASSAGNAPDSSSVDEAAQEPERKSTDPAEAPFDPSLLYVKKTELNMCDEYYLCYGNDETEIGFLGIETPPETPYYLIGGTVYFINDAKQLIRYDTDTGISTIMRFYLESDPWVVRIKRTEGDWLYCSVEFIGEDSGIRPCKIKADFTEFVLDE